MRIDELLESPVLRKALQAGEEKVGKVVGKLLASDGVTTGIRSLFSSALQARSTLEKGVSQALHAANLPSKDDVAALKRRLEELEKMIDGLTDRVGSRRPPGGGKKGGEEQGG